MSKHYDFAIIGQGIAGTVLHHLLTNKKLNGLVIDKGHESAASKVASGLINPITGRKYVRSWMYDKLKLEVDQVYGELEDLLGIKIIEDHKIVRVLSSIKEENLWYTKSKTEGYEKYFVDEVDSEQYKHLLKDATSYGEVLGGAKLDMKKLISEYRKYLYNSDQLLEAAFDYEKLQKAKDQKWCYQDYTFDRVICCEGWQLRANPFFEKLGQEAAKGEVLIIKLKDVKLSASIKKKVFITPLGDDLFWIGSTYEWEFENHEPTQAKKSYLIKALDDMIEGEYEIVGHWAGVRPTTLDRRPLLGNHPEHHNLYVFNGLGTKGASLAPYWAKQMVSFILGECPIPSEVNITRFS